MTGIAPWQVLSDFGDLRSSFYLLTGVKKFRKRISGILSIGTNIHFVRRHLAALGVWPIDTYSPNLVNFAPGNPAMRREASVLH